MKEESGDKKHENNCGIVGVVLGILALILIIMPIIGLILGIIGVIFSYKQNRVMKNKWAIAGIWMGWIAILLSTIWSAYYIQLVVKFTSQYMEQLGALQAIGGVGTPA